MATRGTVTDILFPYELRARIKQPSAGKPLALFFGTDFYNLPVGSDLEKYADATNRMLNYMRKNLPGHEFIYLPHPNEKDEQTKLDLTGFEIHANTIGEIFMYENADRIRAVFSSCSWASGSAYAMGYRSGVFLDFLTGVLPDDAVRMLRNEYFYGFPEDFFIRSDDQPLPEAPASDLKDEQEGKRLLLEAFQTTGTVWFLATEPAYGIRAAYLARLVRAQGVRTGMLQLQYSRWEKAADSNLFAAFDVIIPIPKIWYTAQPGAVLAAVQKLLSLKKLPLKKGDVLVSFAHTLIPENALLSWFPSVKKILLLETRWHHFNYVNLRGGLPEKEFHTLPGIHFFNLFVEPLLGMYRSRYVEHKDGKMMNFTRYENPLEEVYDHSFILAPKLPYLERI